MDTCKLHVKHNNASTIMCLLNILIMWWCCRLVNFCVLYNSTGRFSFYFTHGIECKESGLTGNLQLDQCILLFCQTKLYLPLRFLSVLFAVLLGFTTKGLNVWEASDLYSAVRSALLCMPPSILHELAWPKCNKVS